MGAPGTFLISIVHKTRFKPSEDTPKDNNYTATTDNNNKNVARFDG